LTLVAEAVYLHFNHITDPQIRMVIKTKSYAVRRSGVDYIGRPQYQKLTEVPHQMVNPKNHVLSVAVLTQRSIHPQPHPEFLVIGDYILISDPGAQGIECLTVLSLVPLAAAFHLKGTLGHVITYGVTSNTRLRNVR
jgi:hypothetical protein